MDSNIPIAIVGMSCRFAGDVSDPEKLWKLCAEGRSAWSKIPSSRFNSAGVYHPNGEKSHTVRDKLRYEINIRKKNLTHSNTDKRTRRPFLERRCGLVRCFIFQSLFRDCSSRGPSTRK